MTNGGCAALLFVLSLACLFGALAGAYWYFHDFDPLNDPEEDDDEL